jgi:uncharacterized membrane protein
VEGGRAGSAGGDVRFHRRVALFGHEVRLRGYDPAPLPNDLWVIYLTGVLLIAGAIGLLLPPTRRLAAICLALLLLALFPANVNAALNDIPLRGRAPTPLWLRAPMQMWLRAPMQILFIAMLWWTSIRKPSAATRRPQVENT